MRSSTVLLLILLWTAAYASWKVVKYSYSFSLSPSLMSHSPLHHSYPPPLSPSTGKTDTDISEVSPAAERIDQRETVDRMVSSFGSERQKRAYAAAKRNKIESDALESALATAVTHAHTEVERASQGEEEALGVMLRTCLSKISFVLYSIPLLFHCRLSAASKLGTHATPQSQGRGTTGCVQPK